MWTTLPLREPAAQRSTRYDVPSLSQISIANAMQSPVAAIRNSPGGVQVRKPSGPRPYNGDMNAVKRTRFRGSPNQIDSDDDLSGGQNQP